MAYALIDIHAVLSVRSYFIAFLAQTLEGADVVDALAVSADLSHQGGALVYVHAVVVVSELEAREAKAVVGSNGVLAGSITTRLAITLIDIHAHGLVCTCFEAIVTDTDVASSCVHAGSMAADVGDFIAFITANTSTAGGQLVSTGAFTAIGARDINTIGIDLAQAVSTAALINIFADEEDVVVAESHGALAAEASNLVDADSIGADGWDFTALINIHRFAGPDVDDKSRRLISTENLVFRAGGDRAWFTRLVPGFADIVGAAAHLLGHVGRELVLTRVVVVSVTHALPHIHTVVSPVDLHVLWRAHAGVVP